MSNIVVIGGGVFGLSVGFMLKRQGISVTVLESEPRAGGKAQTVVADGFTCEEATNGWLDKEPAMRTLLDDLQLSGQLLPCDPAAERRFVFRRGELRQIEMHPLKFMLSSLLPLSARLRLAVEPLVPKSRLNGDETLAHFADRRLGKTAREILVGPMASGVYAGDPSLMSLKSCFGKVYELERQYGSLIKGMIALKKQKKAAGEDPATVQAGPSGRLTSLRGGMSQLIGALVDVLGDDLHTSCPVSVVRPTATGQFEIRSTGHAPIVADVVISAAPAWAAKNYLAPLDDKAAQAMGQIPYPALDVVCLGFEKKHVERPIDGFGFLVPRHQGKTILGSLWTSSIFDGRAPDDHVLMRTMIGGMLEPQVAGWSNAQLIETVRRDLEDIVGVSRLQEPAFLRVFRHKLAIPQYHVGHEELLKSIRGAEQRSPGFFAGGNAVGGIGVIDCVRESSVLAHRVIDYLQER